MTSINKIYFLLFLALIVSSCYKDTVIKDDSDLIFKDHPKVEVTCDVVGTIYNEFGKELTGYSNNLLNQIYNSDNSAYYHFHAIDANQNGTLFQTQKNGKSYQFTIKPLANEVNYFRQTIFTEPKVFRTSSEQSHNIDLSENTNLKIELNSFLLDNNQYHGNIKIDAITPDLENPTHLLSLPGDHLAIDKDGNEVWIDIFDAVNIKFSTNDKDLLQIKKKQAHITIKNTNCSNCIVWNYDTKLHKWTEHSLLNNGNDAIFYIAEGGYYCLAQPYIYNQVQGEIHNKNIPIINRTIDIFIENRLIERVFTTNNGKWFTHLPINTDIDYTIKINTEDSIKGNFSIVEDDLILAPIDLNKPEINTINLNGEIRNCNNKTEDNGFIKLWQGDNIQYIFYKDAEIDFDLIGYDNISLSMQTIDEQWENIGPKVNYTINNKSIDFAKAYSCNQIKLDGYFALIFDGKEKLFSITEATLENGRTKLEIYDKDDINTEFYLLFSGQESRQYNDDELNISFTNLNLNGKIYDLNCLNSDEGCGFEYFIIEEFGEKKNSWIKGKFKANFWVKSYDPLTASYKKIEGSFLIPKNF